jgi:hypothetical protein
MKQLSSKFICTVLGVSILIFSCKTDQKTSEKNEIAKDTITTASGLKYFYNTKGKGKKVIPSAKVTAMLSLKVNDSVIWTSYAAKDSSFTYIADRGGVIKGYNEMAMLLREGDDVTAFIPGSIAYGERGSGKIIPPNATLEYNQFKITHVGEPKLVFADSLFTALKDGNLKKMKALYKQVTATKDSALYHTGIGQLNSLWRKLRGDNLFAEANDAFTFINKEYNNSTFDFYIIRSLENMKEYKKAISKIDAVLKSKLTADQKEYFIKYKADLTKKLEKN